jgi:subtilase family serine protease
MNLGFNTSGNNQTYGRTTSAVLLGNLRNTVASTTRKFKYCNKKSSDLNVTFNCVFNVYNPENINTNEFEAYHILNSEKIELEDIIDELPEENGILTKSILRGPFTPNQIKKAYSINNIIPLRNIRRPIVTIVAAYNNPYLQRDIDAFGRVFGLPKCNYTIHNFSRRFSPNWAVEATLNVQWVYAINPHAQIRIVLAASHLTNDMLNAVKFANNKNNFKPPIDTDIMSMSWGSQDTGNLSSYNNSFTNSNTIYLASSGNNNRVSVPSACTNVLAIGGTSLNINASFNRVLESVWSKSGCGYSLSFNKPVYQPSISSNNKRISPDVACVADPNTPCYIIIGNKAYTTGGTSLAAPIVAGMLSLVTQSRLNNRKFTYTSVANNYNSIQPLLYNRTNSDCFFDVTQGNSSIYSAASGFDVASGNGVFNVNNAVNKLG